MANKRTFTFFARQAAFGIPRRARTATFNFSNSEAPVTNSRRKILTATNWRTRQFVGEASGLFRKRQAVFINNHLD